jgi:hypothetical protein
MQVKATTACLECHEARIILQQRLSKAAWSKEVDKMTKWGALVDPSDRDALIDYLSTNFGPDQPPYEAPRTSQGKTAQGKVAPGKSTQGKNVVFDRHSTRQEQTAKHCLPNVQEAMGHYGSAATSEPNWRRVWRELCTASSALSALLATGLGISLCVLCALCG